MCKIKDIPTSIQLLNFMYRQISGLKLLTASLCLSAFLPVSLFAFQDPPESTPPVQTPPSANPGPVQSKPTQAPPSGAGAPVDSATYKIGPTDVLLIRVWNEPEFSGPVAVHQDGKFTLPLVGDLDAGDKTPVEVQDTVTQALKKYVNKPLVTVTVQDVGSKKYFMDGLVARPGEYPLVNPTTVLEAISRAGGLGEFANSKHVYVLRGDKRIMFNYHDVLRGKHMDQNISLQPGDHVVAP